MLEKFEEMKADSQIMKNFEEIEDNQDTNNAIKELYPDMDFTITDILHNDQFASKSLNMHSHSQVRNPKKLQSRSVMAAYGQKSTNKSLNRSITTDYHDNAFLDRNRSVSHVSLKGRNGELLNLFPDLRSKSPMKSIEHPGRSYGDPLGLRRLGVYKNTRFSVSNKSRATGPTSNSSFLAHKSMASEKTTRFAKSIPYE